MFGWLDKFKTRYRISMRKVIGESGDEDKAQADNYRIELKKLTDHDVSMMYGVVMKLRVIINLE